ncbi:MAG TPA: lectin-like protein [Polyangiaceae bacterium]|jgi:hypothetical protein|nr:lectin-like protein [Polyangiaceae bacterium]
MHDSRDNSARAVPAPPPARRELQRRGAVIGPLIGAVMAAGCLPLDDLSRYSDGAPSASDAGRVAANENARTPNPPAHGSGSAVTSPLATRSGTPRAGSADRASGRAPGAAPPAFEPSDAAAAPVRDGCLELASEPDAGSGSCYALSTQRLPWVEALATCEAWGGSLVSINSALEDERLGPALSAPIWLGANDREREGTQRWANGDPFEFERFGAGEPNNAFGVQDCVERRDIGTWGDRACTVPNDFLCERPLAP